MLQLKSNNLLIFQSRLLLPYPEIIHGISTRPGGISRGAYRALNISFMVGDKASSVRENRRRLAKSLGISPKSITAGRQVHGCNIKIVRSKDRGRRALSGSSVISRIDGMITGEPGISLLAFSADCPLIICYEPVKKVCAVIHSSWRGAVKGIVGRAIRSLRHNFGCLPRHIIAVISPSIGPCCYEVKSDFIEVVRRTNPLSRRYFITKNKKTYFDLWSFNRALLRQAGVEASHIDSADLCTCHQPELFYSFRRDGIKTGRFGVIIGIKKN